MPEGHFSMLFYMSVLSDKEIQEVFTNVIIQRKENYFPYIAGNK